MTTSQLYAIYVSAYADAARLFADGAHVDEVEFAGRVQGLSAAEQAVATFALHDATNGTPIRSRANFERAVENAAPVLDRLALGRHHWEQRSCRPAIRATQDGFHRERRRCAL